MSEFCLVCSMTRLNFLGWKKNPQIVLAFILAFVFCVMISANAIMFARTYGTIIQIFVAFLCEFRY